MSKQVLSAGDPMPAIHIQPDATLNSTPDTVLWGYIAANLPPALTIKSGQIVQIEALSHQRLTSNQDPVKFSLATVSLQKTCCRMPSPSMNG